MILSLSNIAKKLAIGALIIVVGACGLPRTGPTKDEIYAGSILNGGNAIIVEVNNRVTRTTRIQPSSSFSADFRSTGVVGSDAINAGDILTLTIFENVKDDPLLGNTGQRVTALDRVQVDGQGFIFVPYAGKIKAAGQSPDSLRELLTRTLDPQTPNPQITIQREAGDGQTVTVSGAVGAQGVYPIERPTRTLTSMLAKAGGINVDPATAIIRITRGTKTGKVWLLDLYSNPKLDIALRGGDKVVVEIDQRVYTILGASSAQQRIPFQVKDLNALEAVAQVGGLSSLLADPTGIFIFRNEKGSIARALMGRPNIPDNVRMVYILNLTEPNGMFEARDFQIRDGDTIYITEAPFAQWQKTIAAIIGTTDSVTSLETAAKSLTP